MLRNSFTNWDDEYYVIQNALLRGPDWAGIFSKPVVSNYHPITIATLAFNYSMTQLDPSSYLITNLLLHLINTALVFYFIWLISGKKIWVAAFSAIVFGIHPMHVESVAWVSERKDVLYTLFFLLSLIQYWGFLGGGKNKNLIYCFLFFALSILSKPAAIILPFVLLTLDYWYGRKFRQRVLLEKIPFLIVSIVFSSSHF
jgi:4-amino-4-deoxy-L-arabinose transferase-like glycosyltransferase